MAPLQYLHEPQPISPATILRPVILPSEPAVTLAVFPNREKVAMVNLAQPSGVVIAQQFDQDVLGDMANLWHTFIDSGQVWALLFGLVIGYMVRGITTY